MSDIKMNCRLWSETQPLGSMLQRLGIKPDMCHIPGRPMGTHGSAAKRVAQRHYATILNENGSDNADVSRWLHSTIALLNAHRVLCQGIHDGTIKAVLWIAILALPAPPDIGIEPRFVDGVVKLGAQILLEDYNKDSDDGNSHKLFLP